MRSSFLVVTGFVCICGCGPKSENSDDGNDGGAGSATGGSATGGSATGGSATGGSATGGSATGGSATGGSTTGGSATGGSATGGSATGGSATGGSATGGSATGGSATGGSGGAMGGSAGSSSSTAATGGLGPNEIPIGSRCSQDRTACMTGLTCRTDFAGERSLCTVECGGSVGCPGNTVCRPVIDYNSEPEGFFCLVPCNTNAECMALGSQCDDRPSAGGEYCF